MAIDSQTTERLDDGADHRDPGMRADESGDWSSDQDQKITIYSSKSEILAPVKLLKQIYVDCYEGRDLAWRLFQRNLRGMYRQTLLGLFWAFLPPIANTAIWIFLKSQNVFNMTGSTGVSDTVYILTGMILWQAFIDAFQMPLNMLKKNQNMISKLKFPREALLMAGIAEVFFNLAIRLLLLIPAFIILKVYVHWTVLVAIPAILAMVCFGAALGLLIMPIGSLYQDVGRFLQMVLPFWMILTPIIYVPPSSFPGNLLNSVNPASPLLIMSRDLLLLGGSEHLVLGIIFAAVSVPLLLIGLFVYRISMPVLIERMTA